MARSKTALTAMAVAALALPAIGDAKTVGRSASGKTVTIAKGERLVIRLRECAPCGYRWKIGTPPSRTILKKTRNAYVEPPQTNPPTAGASGTRVIAYLAKRAGTTKLRIDYVGPSGQNGGHFRLTVRVRA